ncbi:glycoside hydrolase family 2 protein [Puteibacter caeruleilacunae]|nr:glycoside hydrolase family 2 protein [Puteibacter caeruleilacunae]
MKRLLIVFLLGVLMVNVGQANDKGREAKRIYTGWLFQYHPSCVEHVKFHDTGFNDKDWSLVSLPHTWQTYETTKDMHPYIRAASEKVDGYWWKGWGYYRKSINLKELNAHKVYSLEFDGVQKYCKLYVNGNFVGDHKGGYTSFYFDITRWMKKGENVISLAVSNERTDRFGGIPPMHAGNFNVYGGIYRDVRLVEKNRIHVPYQGSYKHEGGTFITTTISDSSKATVHIKSYVKNDCAEDKSVLLTTSILSPKGKVLQQLKKQVQLKQGVITEVVQESSIIKNPGLWSPDTPNLYKVETAVYEGKALQDRIVSPLGFRWFHWDYDKNTLVLNGKEVHIHGTNRHQEYPWVGDALPKWLTLRDFLDIKNNLGHNFIRAAHYPNDKYVSHLTDSLGLINVEEVPNIKSINFSETIQEQNVREMIRRDRNHPSILFWSMGNESNDAADSKWAWEEDTTRILHQRKTQGFGDFVTHDHTHLDMENLLRVTVRGWYDKDVKNLEPANTVKNPKSGQHAGTEEWQHKMARVDGGSIRGRIDKNIVAWLYEDHGCDRKYKNAPLNYINYKGWVDSYRVPKYLYYLWQAHYAPYTMIYVQPHHWRKQYLGQRKDFQVDSNCEKVELWVNNQLKGTQYPTADNFYSVTFKDILVEKGTIKVIGTKGKEKVTDEVVMAGEPAQLKVWAEYDELKADGAGLALIWVDILDEDGNHVYGATNQLHWEVNGVASLVGAPTYTSDINKTQELDGQGYIDAPAFNIVRTGYQSGNVQVKVSSPGLKGADVSFKIKKANDVDMTVVNAHEQHRVVRDPSFKSFFILKEFIKRIDANTTVNDDNHNGYRDDIDAFIKHRNKNTSGVAYDMFLDEMAAYLNRMKGVLIADDYNFLVENYNQCCSLIQHIKDSDMESNKKTKLINAYGERMMKNKEVLDMEAELKKLKIYR